MTLAQIAEAQRMAREWRPTKVAKRRRQPMIRIAITEAAFKAITATLPLGSVAYEAEPSERGVALHLLDLGGDISGNGLSKLFLTIAAAFAEAERDRIRERIGQVKADQKARGRYLGGKVPFGFRRGEGGGLVPHEVEQETIREIVALRGQGRSLRAIAAATGSAMRAWRASYGRLADSEKEMGPARRGPTDRGDPN
jgi:hypothetical protein